MKKFDEIYKSKLIPLEKMPDLLQSNTDVIVAQCASEPQGCMSVFHLAKNRVKDVKVFSVLTMKPYDFYMKHEMKGHFELCSWFHAPGSRQALKEKTGTVTYVPNMLHRAASDRMKVRRPHLFVGTCTPPDDKGFVSLSLGITYEKDIIEAAEIVVLEVNEMLPRTYGDTQVHVADVDYFVEYSQMPPTLPEPQPDEVAMAIGKHIANLVDDGATIQLGIGEIPNAAALMLKDKKDLGVHTEMLVDSMMELYEMGVITNKAKSVHKGKFVCTFAMGSEKLYKWLDNNPAVEFLRGSYVNDPCMMRKNSKMVSINTCIMIDFTGQVASESIGIEQYSGTGGQSDTAVGATEGFDGKGKSIIACRSTAKRGTISTIVPVLPAGTGVTLHRSNTDYVVTEHGSVRLTGLTVRERTEALISIAHPDFREELTRQAREMGYIF
ncbi:MAG: acetyl-CoA hydrolase/transferase C-terminal domain-containing protein [Tenuifilaceae bacterium]|jgi:acyl-CoA hydrolase|nr:acetyl-CoA hydrolase/transferase C-terminal domain-containing protein [Bacteroidales bacterium]MDI9516075.1 acetyl-CoA hydrolase/transferase C-terminal domain-containing protein [Bacteroidota bacterium]NLH56022.1 acetyl-CoA hydrolase/transferase family protein [Rikenellaceae bacterium]OQC62295.1 MAG: Succinyl-CoA:coenzyme A transferase [Bacteroidetes bacterium ADurb.Bin008]HNS28897.1 acetyl-CoA hydrolase/transferase C-terminal domain-containing protein [Tenuifilaceae bacterium]